jgi:hypothetical protein
MKYVLRRMIFLYASWAENAGAGVNIWLAAASGKA